MHWAFLIALAVILFLVLTLIPVLRMRGQISALQKRNRLIRNDGVPVTAEVISFAETGLSARTGPVVQLRLRVSPPAGDPYDAEIHDLVPEHHLAAVQPGATVPVRMEPHSPSRVALDLDRADPSREGKPPKGLRP